MACMANTKRKKNKNNGVVNSNVGEEWGLVPSTKYNFAITNQSGATISVYYEFLFYETTV